MHTCGDLSQVSRDLQQWFGMPLGKSLQVMEINRLRDILPQLYGPTALQVGRAGEMDMLETSLAANHIILDQPPLDIASGPRVWGRSNALPFDNKSVDLVLLPHTLEFADDPRQVLREVGRVVVPEGHVVILGFNPFSLWGLRRLFAKPRGHVPWCGHFLSLTRVKDWLALLGFKITGGSMLYHRPPVTGQELRDRLYFMEKGGERWWPMIAAVYIVVARKCEFGLTPLLPAWKRKKAVPRGLAEPVAKGIRRERS